MGSSRRMYLGTSGAGVVVLSEEGGRWAQEAKGLEEHDVECISVASDGSAVFAAVEQQGVYASRDHGATWALVLAADVRAVAVDPSDPHIVYAGTEPVHLHRSTDSGVTWEEMPGLQQLPEHVREKWWFPQPPHDGHVKSIFVDPQDGRTILLGLEHGGIVRSFDGGATWEDLSDGIEYLDLHDVGRDPVERGVSYAATARGFYRNDGGGKSWELAVEGLTRDFTHDFLVCEGASESVLFLTTANGSPPAWIRPSKAESSIFRSTDQARTWEQVEGGLPFSSEMMAWRLAGDPMDRGRLYAVYGEEPSRLGGLDDRARGEVWTSGDCGESWDRVHALDAALRCVCVVKA